MSDTTQVYGIYFMSDGEDKKMVMLEDYLKSLSDIHKLKKRIAELEAQTNEFRNLLAISRIGDQTVEFTFASCRSCSAVCKMAEQIVADWSNKPLRYISDLSKPPKEQDNEQR